jgi:hypothetical protein
VRLAGSDNTSHQALAAARALAADVNDCLTTLDLVRGKGGKAFGVMLDVRDSAFAREMVGAATGALTH